MSYHHSRRPQPSSLVAMHKVSGIRAGLVAAALLLSQGGALAALGEKAESVEADRQKLNAPASKVAKRNQFNVHELTAETGVVVREFVREDGTVFAVSWEGPVKPDLQQILGTYFSVYTSAPARQKSRGLHQVHQDALVVQSAGRVRAFRGFAYVPALMPSGLTAEDLQ